MKKKKQLMLVCLASILMILMSGCVPGDGSYTDENRAGFFWGIWHGWLAPVSLIMGIFNNHLRVYEILNTGWWYDLGFYMAIISGFGSLSFFRKKETKKNY